WETIMYNGEASDYFGEGNMLYFMKQNEDGAFLYEYNTVTGEDEILKPLECGSRLLGKIDRSLYYLEQDPDVEDYEGKTLKSYNLDTEEEISLAGGIGRGQFWNNHLVLTGMATDIRPVPILMLDKNMNFGLVDENCGSSFYDGEEGFYYIRHEMTDDTSWSGITVCTITSEGRRSIVTFNGEYAMGSILTVKDGYLYLSLTADNASTLYGIDVETGATYETEVPVPGKIPTVCKDGLNTYWISDGGIYYWKGAGYREAASIPSDCTLAGIADGKAYYWQYYNGEKELYQITLG
ncbi:MAG: hypothetical protein SOX32_08580, partial [Candidatus Choladocola sp.]|nr:hypothetical protein [Candidatus Choladocola sp.]